MEDLKEKCFEFRQAIEHIKTELFRIREQRPSGEIGANITLAYRHLEDARMRLGKAIQALDGGTSCYPR